MREISRSWVIIHSRLEYDQQTGIDLPEGEMNQRPRGSHRHWMKERKQLLSIDKRNQDECRTDTIIS